MLASFPHKAAGSDISSRLLLCCICCFLFWPLLAASAEASSADGRMRLVLENQDGKPLYSMPVADGSAFGIRYLHSVALSPVTDYFSIKNGGIWLDSTVYQDFGAGLPHAPENGQIMRTGNGKITISGYNRRLGSFQLRVGRIARHTLLLLAGERGSFSELPVQEIPLSSLAPPGSVITFSVRPAES